MIFRIKRTKKGYKIQKKNWFFWYHVGTPSIDEIFILGDSMYGIYKKYYWTFQDMKTAKRFLKCFYLDRYVENYKGFIIKNFHYYDSGHNELYMFYDENLDKNCGNVFLCSESLIDLKKYIDEN
jgi:hypothetical protein